MAESVGSVLPARPEPVHASQLPAWLVADLRTDHADEIDHRADAAARLDRQAAPASRMLRLWIWAVGAGSRGAVKICRWV